MFSVDSNRVCGLIKSYFQDRLFGFILYEDSSGAIQDVFYHVTEFKPDTTPQAGQIVEFYLTQRKRGLRATDCVLLRNTTEILQTDRMVRLHEQFQKAIGVPSMSRPTESTHAPLVTSAPADPA